MKPVMYVVVNKGLNMSAGKVAAQAVHATLGITAHMTHDWVTHPHRWVIILEAEDETHLNAIAEYLSERKVDVHLVIDEGVNEIRPYSYTALGVQILDKDSAQAEYLSRLPLYKELKPTIVYWGRRRCEFCGVPSGDYHLTKCPVLDTILWK